MAAYKLNLPTLKRTDPTIEDILDYSSHVSFYLFSSSTKSWSKMEVEGSLFVVECKKAPFYKMIVLNKLSKNNFILDIGKHLELQVSSPYIIIRHKDVIYGLWFPNDEERDRVCKLVISLKTANPKKKTEQSLSKSEGYYSKTEPVSIKDELFKESPKPAPPLTGPNLLNLLFAETKKAERSSLPEDPSIISITTSTEASNENFFKVNNNQQQNINNSNSSNSSFQNEIDDSPRKVDQSDFARTFFTLLEVSATSRINFEKKLKEKGRKDLRCSSGFQPKSLCLSKQEMVSALRELIDNDKKFTDFLYREYTTHSTNSKNQ